MLDPSPGCPASPGSGFLSYQPGPRSGRASPPRHRVRPRLIPTRAAWVGIAWVGKNLQGRGDLFPVNDEQDGRWARRLKWAIKEHLDRAEDDLDKLQSDYESVLRQSR
jgi:hypothetical protein